MRTDEEPTQYSGEVTGGVRKLATKTRPRAPRALLKNRGTLNTPQHRDQKNLISVVVEDPIGPPPDWFTDEEKKTWKEIVATCPVGVLTSVDHVILEQMVCLLTKCRAKHWDVTAQVHQRMTMLLGLLGMTPADRSRVSIKTKRVEANPYDD